MALLRESREPSDTDWEPGPGEHDITHQDDVKIKFRKFTEDYLVQCKSIKDLFKKKFVNISTNVLCAVVDSDKEHIPNYIRDLYMPVELSVTKWSLDMEEKDYVVHHFMFHPGEPARNCRVEAQKHQPMHKITGIRDGPLDTPREKYKEVLSTIYQLVSHDYTLFSMSIKHIRQDLGSIKWLVDQVCGPDGNRKKYKPLKIYSLQDLYICVAKRVGFFTSIIGTKVAEKRLDSTGYEYELDLLCHYHKQPEYETCNCTRANCMAKARKFTRDIKWFQTIIEAVNKEKMPAEGGEQHVEADPSSGQGQPIPGSTVENLEESFGRLTTRDTGPRKPPTWSRK